MRILALLGFSLSVSFAWAGVPGTYVIDKAALKEMMNTMLDQQLAMIPEEQRGAQMEVAKQAMAAQLESMNMTLTFHSGGTVEYEGNTGMGQSESGKGTWKLEGDQLTMTKTERDGEKTEPDSMTATYKDDKIIIKPEGTNFEMVLVKK